MVYTAVVLTAGLLFPAEVFGHGVEAFNMIGGESNKAQSVYFKYSTGEPMMYAKIRVYPPSQPDMEILQSITDRNGYFMFMPDETGDWKIDAEDGMGHLGSIMIPVQSLETGDSGGAVSSGGGLGSTPLVLRLLLGLSLILNVFAVYGFIASRKV
ncbi:MAG: hypothetical protein LBG73_10095 [Spirochaetaceae bacterium]|jgi:nickel transport protein|nr:hypothetical protein [Spirochaetaceae bacterium]